MAQILESAVEFAKKIQTTEEYLNLQKAKKNNDEDVKLVEMIEKFNSLTQEVKNLIESKNSEKEKIDSKNVEISEIYKKIMLNSNMINFNKASNEMNILMNKIHQILVDAVNGKEPTICSNNDSFSCGSCGKCSGKI